ncbi:FGGY-family carbohydrate kinase [Vannielia sp. SX4]|uniref:FGGY-family carbohydrate kinase n=1 Tax=Vannielia sp. SX4 TaxID=3463852 RepID=UPI00405A3932
MTAGHIAVIDIGKTNAKLALVDLESLAEVAVLTRPNRVLPGPPWPHFDVEGHWAFLLEGLAQFQAAHGVDAISVTTHGASAALIGEGGELAAPILDYEHAGPDGLAAEYDAIRPAFAETGAPRLGIGLNLGAQLFWQFSEDPGLKARVRHVVTYPQYWGYRLTRVAASDVTSLGCHTDLWNPLTGAPSSLVERLGIAGLLAPTRQPGEVLGTVLPEIAAQTGLEADTPVYCGIHDSNASLLAHLLAREAPFSVVSTGTWVIAMAIGGAPVALDPARDTLVNVNAFGDPVPSARFMGGREHDLLMAGAQVEPSADECAAVLREAVMLLPSVVPGSGPFQGHEAQWLGGEPPAGSGARSAAVGFYLALVTDACLRLIGHRGPIHVEGPFARNACYLDMLAAASGAEVHAMTSATGTSEGAALLHPGVDRGLIAGRQASSVHHGTAEMARYAEVWRARVR